MNRSTKGARCELIAGAYLMDQGYDVFRSESPACPFDLVAHRDGQLLRVEVKAVGWTKGCPIIQWPSNDQWDLLLHVDGVNVYETTDKFQHRAVDSVRTRLGLAPADRRSLKTV